MAKKEPGLPLRVEFDAVRRPKKETVFFLEVLTFEFLKKRSRGT